MDKLNKENSESHYSELSSLMKENPNNEIVSLLAHELIQPLMVAKTYASGCLIRLRENSIDNIQLISAIEKITQNISYLGNKICEIQISINEKQTEVKAINIHDVIYESLLLISYELQTYNIRISMNFEENFPLIKADKMKIKHILLSLIKMSINDIDKNEKNCSSLLIQTKKTDKDEIKIDIKVDKPHVSKSASNNIQTKETELEILREIIKSYGGKLLDNSSQCSNHFYFTLSIA